MKTQFAKIASFLAATSLLGAASLHAQSVTLYEHPNYGGETLSLNLGEGIENLSDWVLEWEWWGGYDSWNDSVSSVAVWENVQVVLYEAANYQGDYIILDRHTPTLPAGWNDRISSLYVTTGLTYGWTYDTTLQSDVYYDDYYGYTLLYHNMGLGWMDASWYDSTYEQGWLYDYALGWMYTDRFSYPWFYRYETNEMVYFSHGTTAPRYFYSSNLGDWFTSWNS